MHKKKFSEIFNVLKVDSSYNYNPESKSGKSILVLNDNFITSLGSFPYIKLNKVFFCKTNQSLKKSLLYSDFIITKSGRFGYIYDALLLEQSINPAIFSDHKFYLNYPILLNDVNDYSEMLIIRHKSITENIAHGFNYVVLEALVNNIIDITLNDSLKINQKIRSIEDLNFNMLDLHQQKEVTEITKINVSQKQITLYSDIKKFIDNRNVNLSLLKEKIIYEKEI
jgi:hypothetical protein